MWQFEIADVAHVTFLLDRASLEQRIQAFLEQS